MTIGKKIALGFGMTWVLLALVGLIGYRTTAKLVENNGWVSHTYEVLGNATELISSMKDVQNGARGFVISGDELFLQPFTAALARIDRPLHSLRELTADNLSQQRRLDAFEPAIAEATAWLKRLVEVRRSKGLKEAAEMMANGAGERGMDTVRRMEKELEEEELRLLKIRNADAEASAKSTFYAIGLGTGFSLLLSFVALVYLIRSISGPVRMVVGQLSSTSSEILAGTVQQAAGAQQQAAAVAETVTTVDEVMQTADHSSQRAKGLGEAIQRSLEIGRSGNRAVEESIAATNAVKLQIEATAQHILKLANQAQAIGEIIATVNDVAEQTNLLALNAAIEASRAGEHGKGFSVVAGEVKVLADKAKKATTQVRQILGDIQKSTNTAVTSTEEVTRGMAAASRVSGQTSDTIRALAETLSEAAQVGAQIVASAAQQATGMVQIHQAIKSMDQVARQYMVATRQAEEAAKNLNKLGFGLTTLVG